MRTRKEIDERIAAAKNSLPRTNTQRAFQAFEIALLHWFLGDDEPCEECRNAVEIVERRTKISVVN
jgi:hypothetical protein